MRIKYSSKEVQKQHLQKQIVFLGKPVAALQKLM